MRSWPCGEVLTLSQVQEALRAAGEAVAAVELEVKLIEMHADLPQVLDELRFKFGTSIGVNMYGDPWLYMYSAKRRLPYEKQYIDWTGSGWVLLFLNDDRSFRARP